jgi:putative hydrolase of the HAD superfamily
MRDLKLNQYSGIVFDLDGTLVHKEPKLEDFIQQSFEQRGLVIDSEQSKEAQRLSLKFWEDPVNYNNDPMNHDRSKGTEFWVNFIQYYCQSLDISFREIADIAVEIAEIIEVNERNEYLAEDTRDVLVTLSARGYKLGVLSNRYSPVSDVVQYYDLSEFISCSYSAGQLGAMKPDERIFHLYLEEFGKRPDEIVYVGDNYWVDIKGAENAKIQPILIDPRTLFPEATCPVIKVLSDLLPILN